MAFFMEAREEFEEATLSGRASNSPEYLGFNQNSGPPLREYMLLREEIRHQDNLLNARLSWLVSSQAFLLTGFAVTLNGTALSLLPSYTKLNALLLASLPVAGLVTDLVSYATIWAAILRMQNIRCLAHDSHPPHLPTVQATAFGRRLGLAGPVLIPIIFFTVWMAIIAQSWS